MKLVEALGPYYYEVTGEREEEAAAALEKELDKIAAIPAAAGMHGETLIQSISAAKKKIVGEYGVTIE